MARRGSRDAMEEEARRKAVLRLGLGLAAGTGLLAGFVFLVQRTTRGEGLKVRITHDVTPELRGLVKDIQPVVQTLATQGVKVHLALGPGRKPR